MSLYCIRSNKHLVNIWTMSTMWRLMLTWEIILELLNNQSQTSHHIDAYITPGTVEQSVVNILTSFNADIDYSANMENDPGTVGQSIVNILTSVDDVEINHGADVKNDPGTVK